MSQDVFARIEKKYLLSPEQYRALRPIFEDKMEPDAFGRHTLWNLYLDTEDYELTRRSIEKPIYKEKMRLRAYGVPKEEDEVFLEIKKKYKGVVYKRRAEMNLREALRYLYEGIRPKGDSQILREIDYSLRLYRVKPRVCLCYERSALFGRDNPDLRVTFDTGIRFRTDELNPGGGARGEHLLKPGSVLMEIKIPGAMPVWMAHALDENGVRQVSFSKIGTAYTNFIREQNDWGGSKLCCKVS